MEDRQASLPPGFAVAIKRELAEINRLEFLAREAP